MPLWARRLDVEPNTVVTKGHLHLVALLLDGDPDVRGLRVLEGVHHPFAGVVIQQQRDRRRHVHLVDVGMEPDIGFASHLHEEPTDRLSESRAPERRPVQVSDQRSDAFGCTVLRLLDLEQQLLGLIDLPRLEVPASDVDLDRKTEQELREVVVQERRDLHAFVLPFLGHPIRQRAKHVLAILKFLVRFLESLAAEEHLTRKQKREDEYGYDPPVVVGVCEEFREH